MHFRGFIRILQAGLQLEVNGMDNENYEKRNAAGEEMTAEDKANAKFIMMTETKIEPLVLRLAIPTIISMLITSIYNMADTYFVGKINTSATGAVGIVFSLMAVIQAIGFFFGHGSGNFISRKLGEKEFEIADRMASIGFFSALFGGCLITIFGFVFMHPLARMLGATDTIMPYACDYMRFILLGAPYMTASLVLNNQMRFQGNAFYAMIGITTGGILNIALDPIFIFGFGLGTSGAALATIISQFVSFCLLLHGTRKKGIPVHIKNFRPTPAFFKEIVRGGLPSLARQGCGSIATICLNQTAGIYGDAAIAAMSIVTRIMMFASSAMIGFGQGFQPVCGFNYGAKKFDRVRKAFWFCVKSSFVVLLAISITGIAFAPQIIELFRKGDPDVVAIGSIALRLQCISFPFTGFVVLCNMMAQTIGKAVKATTLALSRQFLFFVPALFLLSGIFGLTGIEWSQAVADWCSLALSVPIGFSILREMKE